jgi:small subunit ribosomal protein S20
VANIKSQIKRNRQNDKQRLRNRVYRGEARIAVRAARATIEEGVPESASALKEAISALDKAAEQGVLHKNNAARRKSRLMKAFSKMEPVQVESEPMAVELILETEPSKQKAVARKGTSKKLAESKAEAVAEPKGGSKKKASSKKPEADSSSRTKKAGTKKPAVKKSATPKKPTAASTPKGKK